MHIRGTWDKNVKRGTFSFSQQKLGGETPLIPIRPCLVFISMKKKLKSLSMMNSTVPAPT